MIKIKVSATSANMGPGFDTLGIAFNLYNEFIIEKADINSFNGQSADNNLFFKAFNYPDIKLDIMLKVTCNNAIPISRGLGSSASLIVAGLICYNYYANNILSYDDIFQMACQLEGHGDNICACLYGGCTICMYDERYYMQRININPNICYTACISDFKMNTQQSRDVLPKNYSIKDVIFNLGHLAYLVKALEDDNLENIKIASYDRIHQNYRKTQIKDYDTLHKFAIDNGALNFVLSGSGSTCLTMSKNPKFASIMSTLGPTCAKWQFIDLQVNHQGVILEVNDA